MLQKFCHEYAHAHRFTRAIFSRWAVFMLAIVCSVVLGACASGNQAGQTSSTEASGSSSSVAADSQGASETSDINSESSDASGQATELSAHLRPIHFALDITGGVEADTSAKFPLQIRGTDAAGNAVESACFIDLEGNGLELAPGSYTAVLSSGTAFADRGMCRLSADAITIELPSNESTTVPYVPEKHIAVDLITDPSTVSDTELQSAYAAALESGLSQEAADKLLADYTELRQSNIDLLASDTQNRADVEAVLLNQATKYGPLIIDAPYYTITLPETWLNNYTFEYIEPRLVIDSNGSGMGCEIEVLRGADVSVPDSTAKTTNEDFHVALITNGSVPYGDNIAVDLATPSNLPGWHVVVYGPRTNAFAADMARFASYVNVK